MCNKEIGQHTHTYTHAHYTQSQRAAFNIAILITDPSYSRDCLACCMLLLLSTVNPDVPSRDRLVRTVSQCISVLICCSVVSGIDCSIISSLKLVYSLWKRSSRRNHKPSQNDRRAGSAFPAGSPSAKGVSVCVGVGACIECSCGSQCSEQFSNEPPVVQAAFSKDSNMHSTAKVRQIYLFTYTTLCLRNSLT